MVASRSCPCVTALTKRSRSVAREFPQVEGALRVEHARAMAGGTVARVDLRAGSSPAAGPGRTRRQARAKAPPSSRHQSASGRTSRPSRPAAHLRALARGVPVQPADAGKHVTYCCPCGVRHRHRVDARAGLELPELSSGIGIERDEFARFLSGEHQSAAGRERRRPDLKVQQRYAPFFSPVSGSIASMWPIGSPQCAGSAGSRYTCSAGRRCAA